MSKMRIDLLLVEKGLVESRAQAQRLVMAGRVRVKGQVALKPADVYPQDAEVSIETGPRYVSRGGEKLQAALQAFSIQIADLICADVGASTGGFTDCLLQNGAARVYAIDVGQGILHWKLRQDVRVVIMEGTNARYVARLAEAVQLVTIDASFISLKLLLPVVKGWFASSPDREPASGRGSIVLALIKPQFEAGRQQVAHGEGIIRDPEIHRQVLLDILSSAQVNGYSVRDLIRSPLLGPKGNAEFLVWLDLSQDGGLDVENLVSKVIESQL